eukprot:UN0782
MECLNAASPDLTDPNGDPPVRRTFDIKSEFQDGGFTTQFLEGLHFSEEDCSISKASLQADYAFLAGVGIVDYSILITLWHPVAQPSSSSGCCTSESCYHCVWWDGRPALGDVAQQSNGDLRRTRNLAVARLGIIDFFQTYNARKLAESVFKRSLLHPRHPAERVTIVHPQLYADRQHDFVLRRVMGWSASEQAERELV